MSEKPRILLVDDDESLVRTLGDLLSFSDYDVVSALDGAGALDKLRAATPDLIVLDISMPKMGGLQFLKALLEVWLIFLARMRERKREGKRKACLQCQFDEVWRQARDGFCGWTAGSGQSSTVRVRAAAR